ncbi:MAG: membrane fusion protein, multidrug efflux system [Glomeribacter sp. 1016415]|nr:membrane fusion protein, multidrug efflux system [Glomeribacter sp. 1016415]
MSGTQRQSPAPVTVNEPPNRKRQRMMLTLGAFIASAAIGYGLYYFLHSRFYETTDDAYVNGSIVQITPQVTGTVVAVYADDTQLIQVGAPLVRLDSADAKLALEEAKAGLAQAVRQVRTLYASNTTNQAYLAQRQTELERAQGNLRRRQVLAESGALSVEEIEHAQNAVASARSALRAAQEQLVSSHALTGRTQLAAHPNVLTAAAKVRSAWLNDARNTLPAPITGYVAKRSVQVGQRVAPGTPLMAVVPLNHVWVDANFKEVQLKQIRLGQPVTLSADMYGKSVVYHGHVAGFSAGTGSAFSLLPAQNATGNWIKVVQRLPVRIALDPSELEKHPLRLGLSMHATIDLHPMPDAKAEPLQMPFSYQTNVFDQSGVQAEEEIQRIIAEHSNI